MKHEANPEVFYCGHCRTKQKINKLKKAVCAKCGKPLVGWFPLYEDETNALRKWESQNAGSVKRHGS